MISIKHLMYNHLLTFNLPVDKNLPPALKGIMNKGIGVREMLDQVGLVHIGDRDHFVDELSRESGCRDICYLDDVRDPKLLHLFARLRDQRPDFV